MDDRLRTGGAVARALLAGVCAGLLVAAVLGTAVAPFGGLRVLTVRSGSMEPAIRTGDAIVVQRARPADLRLGDVVTFTDPADRSRLITHRVRTLRVTPARTFVTTKGDANTGVERWSVASRGEVAIARSRLPGLGYALAWTSSLAGRLALIVVPAVLLCVLELRRIWRRDAAPAGEPVSAAG